MKYLNKINLEVKMVLSIRPVLYWKEEVYFENLKLTGVVPEKWRRMWGI